MNTPPKDDQSALTPISGTSGTIYDPFAPYDPNNIPEWMHPAPTPVCPPGQVWNPALHRCAIIGSKDDPNAVQVRTYQIPTDPVQWIKVDQNYWKNYETWLLNVIHEIKVIYDKDITYSVKMMSTGPFPDVSTKLNYFAFYQFSFGGALYDAGPGLYVRANGNYARAALLIGRVFGFREVIEVQG